MIISHKYQFIYVKTKKTASTSIEIALSRLVGEHDVITPIAPADESYRGSLGIEPINYSGRFNPLGECFHETRSSVIRSLKDMIKGRKYYNHLAAKKIRNRVGHQIWNSYYKFSFERNPWDKVLSHYYWRTRNQQNPPSFDEYLDEGILPLNWNLYTIDDVPALDFVGRYENLASELAAVCERVGLPYDGWMPRAKAGIRKDKRRYQDSLSDTHRNRIAELFSKEIDFMGFTF